MMQSSIQRRLIATVVLSETLLAAGLLIAGIYDTRERLLDSLDANMQARAMSVAALVRYNEDASGNVYFDDTLVPSSIDPEHPDVFAVWAERSGFLTRSKNWPSGLTLQPEGKTHWGFKWAGVHYRGLRVLHAPVLDREEGKAFQPQTLTVLYASPTAHVEEEVREAGISIAVVSLLLLIAAVLLTIWGVRRGLFPLQQLATEAGSITANNWDLRLSPEVRQIRELRPLTESMTTMLARLQSAFVEQREFLANAAHELKTPVAVLKSTMQSLLQRPRTSEEYRAGLEHSLEDLERLEQLLQWMLRLARAEQWAHGTLRRDLQVIDLTQTCEDAVERLRPLADSRHIAIRLSKNGPVSLRADPEDLLLVWINLLENAIRYSAEGGAVEMAVSGDKSMPSRITVEDHGVGIAAEDLPHVFRRFYRADTSRNRATGGFGLGLAIAKSLVEAYGGTIAAESTPGQGTRMTVEWPLSKEL
jgi:heavy metal sensor kinase